ncbi:YhgE/Pip domain-containing protein [Paenibacillus flagellatus]|uniref:ABC transporter n=1 Tax=Paenibacillus flagellatus TaxID=2211139 RepID=A0A2V5JY14_9BACL|nr:ABC transporter permease [Paenibacillus flagellatus]PYI51611.1 ABC transporter [Paenibacillus flagellatus]
MLKALQTFLQKTPTKLGIATAILFQLIFSVVWMTGYNGVTDHTSRLKIAIVNEDAGLGGPIAEQLQSSLPFQVSRENGLEEAQKRLNERDVQMVVRIPADFSKQLQTPGQKAELQYWINESNPALIKSIMTGVAGSVTAAVNKQAVAAGAQTVLTQMNAPAAQAQSMAQQLAEKVTSNVQSTNPVSGMNNQMVPMMLVLASYVGSMIMGMNLHQSSLMIGSQLSRWRKFGARAILNVFGAVVTSLIGSSFVLMLGGQSVHGFMALWGFQTLCLLSFMFFSQTFLLLFGNAGMLFNIIALSAQLVSSGALVPRELLSDFYHRLGSALPATYAVEGNMNLLFGGPSASGPAIGLVIVMAASIVAGIAITALRQDKAPAAAGPVHAAEPTLAR